MSRLLCLSRVCARCTVFSARCQGQQQLVKRFLIQQQSAYVGGSSLPKNRTNSKLWLCGVGVGLALAVGLKSRSDTADSSCEKRETEAARYRRAAEVGRELLERIDQGRNRGRPMEPETAFTFSFISCEPLFVFRLRSVLRGWWWGSLWTVFRSGVKVVSHCHTFTF